MRRTDREVVDSNEIRAILSACRVCRLALSTGGVPYIVPMNFGFCMEDGALTLYFHSALEGRKIDLLRQNPLVGFEVDREIALIEGETACKYGYAFESVIGEGRACFLTEQEEKCRALAQIMLCQTGRAFAFSPEDVKSVSVIAVTATSYTAKRRPMPM